MTTRTVTYPTAAGPVSVEYDPDAPCRLCGEPVIEASMSGTDVCPWCDIGQARPDIYKPVEDPIGDLHRMFDRMEADALTEGIREQIRELRAIFPRRGDL